MHPTLKGAVYVTALFIGSEIIYQIYRKYKRKSKHRKENESKSRLSKSSLQVLFFPDKDVACRDYFISGDGCFKSNCQFSHSKTSLSELCKHMMSSQRSLDVCVFVITCRDLADILLKLHRRGVKIRIITDKGMLHTDGSQIWTLQKEGIAVRTNNSSFFMHHKFAIKDQQVLINGSFNWTRQAITGNQENVLITDDLAVTSQFMAEFQKLWEHFDTS
ncbi:mitochondrial cardiolipin hydrolase [Aplysia californica]|uniref:Mitochondrial cardiolipin hydrolase n=1 Tax=Aplysia californica TaxID=6500 RepID=A0ABM0JG27_APLCA|nr:mitochondrial cardiolipin hydrolase [Aplysia californica]